LSVDPKECLKNHFYESPPPATLVSLMPSHIRYESSSFVSLIWFHMYWIVLFFFILGKHSIKWTLFHWTSSIHKILIWCYSIAFGIGETPFIRISFLLNCFTFYAAVFILENILGEHFWRILNRTINKLVCIIALFRQKWLICSSILIS